MDFDRMLKKCGDAGRYQYLMLGLLGYIAFISTVHYYSQNMISFVPPHWCYHEQLLSRSYAEIAALYEPFGQQASCTRLLRIDGDNVTVSSERCQRWIYKYDYGFRSMNAELNWVCDDAYKARIGQSLFFVGSLLGTLIFGMLGDKYGRVPALILANQCGFIGDFSTTYASNLLQFTVCRFISGLAAPANYYLMFILVLEYLAPKLRNLAISLTLGICFCLGGLAAPWLSVLAGNWRIYLICSSLMYLLVALFYLLVQESAQWLITNSDLEGAIARLKHIAHFNGHKLRAADFEDFRGHCQQQRRQSQLQQLPKPRLFDMLKTPHLRKTALLVLLTFMLQSLAFNTISRSVEGLGLSPFVVFSLYALAVPPSGLVQGVLQSRLGRKITLFAAMLFTALLCLALALVLSSEQLQRNWMLLLAFALPMRFGVSLCYTTCSQLATELIPTCVRSRGLAAMYVAGAAASFLSPYLIHLRTKFAAAPSLILSLLLCVGALTTLLLPETNNRQLPISLQDGENFGKDEPLCDVLCCRRPRNTAEKTPMEQMQQLHPKPRADEAAAD